MAEIDLEKEIFWLWVAVICNFALDFLRYIFQWKG